MALEQSMLETLMRHDRSRFETLVPSRILSFLLPNYHPNHHILNSPQIYICVIDSPSQPDLPAASVAAMIIPPGLESDWVFCTERGQLQLLCQWGAQFARLVLIGNYTNSTRPENYIRLPNDFQEKEILEANLIPFVRALCPGNLFASSLGIHFGSFNSNVKSRRVLAILEGDSVGEMLIEDIQFDSGATFRNLKFKRNPNLIQTQLPLGHHEATGGVESLVPDTGVLHQKYFIAMVTSLSLIAPYLDGVILHRLPRALCLGVGGGALISFLSDVLHFEVVAVELDEAVLRVATHYFGLNDTEVKLIFGNSISLMEKLASYQDSKDFSDFKEFEGGDLSELENLDTMFDVIMVDLDSRDAQHADTAPPSDFVKNSVLLDAKSILNPGGILVINVRSPDHLLYHTLVTELKRVFLELRGINVGAVNGGGVNNFILIAAASPLRDSFLTSLRLVISRDYMGLIETL